MDHQHEKWNKRKVVIVGAGAVGSSYAYAQMQHGAADEIVLIDKNQELVEGQAQDLSHGRALTPPVEINAGSEKDYADASVIVMTAGAKQKEGESRLDLLGRNIQIMEAVVDDIVQQDSKAVIVVVSNPVDILTYAALEKSGWDRHRIIGSGTVLDSIRFKHLLSRHCGVDIRNVHAYILGEHGDSEFAAWSMAHIAGLPMEDYCRVCGACGNWREEQQQLVDRVRKAAYHIIDYKGATNWGIGLALTRIVGTILRNENSVLPVSVRLEGEYDQKEVCLSVPCVISNRGIEKVLIGNLSEKEKEALKNSADILRENYQKARNKMDA